VKELSHERTLPAITPLAFTVTVTVSCCSKQAFADADASANASADVNSPKLIKEPTTSAGTAPKHNKVLTATLSGRRRR